jgi:ribosomal protein S27AE
MSTHPESDRSAQTNSGNPSDRTTMTDVIDGYREAGYVADFGAEPEGRVSCGNCHVVTPAQRFAVESLRRLEGASDPDDMVAIVASSCPVCGADGTLVLGYGPSASPVDADVSVELDDRRDADARLPRSAAPDESGTSTAQ